MSKLWQWIMDKKTNTLRKWRSSTIHRASNQNGSTSSELPNDEDEEMSGDGEDDDEEEADGKRKAPMARFFQKYKKKKRQRKRNRKSHSVGSLGSSQFKRASDFENFFEEPQVKNLLEKRRDSFRHSTPSEAAIVAASFPVVPPDVEEAISRERRPVTVCETPRTARKQLRFDIPEVRVSFEDNEPRRVTFNEPSSIVPPPEIDWSPEPICVQSAGCSPTESPLPPAIKRNSFTPEAVLCFDDEVTVSGRRMSANERARQNVIAQRRQSNVHLVHTMSGRTTTTTLIPLTCAQIHLVRALWRQVYTSKGPTVIGESVYHRLCFKNLVVKEQMKRVELPPKFQNRDNFIKAHCKAVAELIDQVVENLDHLDNVSNELIRIGRVHAKLLRGQLNGKLWNTVAETIIDCTLEWGDRRCRSETVRKAWALIVAFMIEKIKDGHHEQRKIMLATRPSLPSTVRLPSLQKFS